jgi:hypothetical protein
MHQQPTQTQGTRIVHSNVFLSFPPQTRNNNAEFTLWIAKKVVSDAPETLRAPIKH